MHPSLLALVVSLALAVPTRASEPERPTSPPRLQRGPIEAGVHLGTVLAAPVQRRQSIGADIGVRLSEILAIDLTGSYAPDFGTGNWSRTTRQIIEQNNVAPKLAHIHGTLGTVARFAPVHGAIGANSRARFDVYGLVGAGIAAYQPDWTELQCSRPRCVLARSRTSPTATMGIGVMVGGTAATALRVELRATTLTLSTEDGGMFRRDECELRLGVSWGGDRRRRDGHDAER